MNIYSNSSALSSRVTANAVNQSVTSSNPPRTRRAFRSRLLRGALRICCLAVFLPLFSLPVFAQSPPAIPNGSFYFPPAFESGWGCAPIAYTTNLISEPVDLDPQDGLYGSALILDTTNLTPAFLNYNILDTNYGTTHRNIFYASGTLLWYYAPNWASVSQGGTGPGETACFIGGGGLVQQFTQRLVHYLCGRRRLEPIFRRRWRWRLRNLRQRPDLMEFEYLASNWRGVYGGRL